MAQTPSMGGRGNGPLPGFMIFLLLVPCFFLILVFLLGAMQYKQMKSLVADRPLPFDSLPESPRAQAALADTLRAFFAGNTHDTLALGPEQVNQLVRASDALKKSGWEYRIGLEDSLFTAANSLPVQQMKGPASLIVKLMRMRGYLNSVMKGYPELKGDSISLVAVSATMNGAEAPQSALSRKGNVNPREWVEDKAFYDKAVSELSEVKVRGGRLLLIKRR
jgi:hypothetical protein